MLVRMDKEFSDITYIPATSLGSQIDEICKRYENFEVSEEERKHNRPYYNYNEQIKLFDQSSSSKQREIQNNPLLMKQL